MSENYNKIREMVAGQKLKLGLSIVLLAIVLGLATTVLTGA